MAEWHSVVAAGEIPHDEPYMATIGDNLIAVYVVGGDAYATTGTCTHEAECLEGGYVEYGKIECPYHGRHLRDRDGEICGGARCR